MRFAYQRTGAPLLSWRGGTAPQGTRAADAKSLGSLGDPTLELPRAGAPEPLPALAGTCGCHGTTSGLIGQPMGGIVDTLSNLSTPAKLGIAAAAFLAYKHFKKRR